LASSEENPEEGLARFQALIDRIPEAAELAAEMEAAAKLHPRKSRAFRADLLGRVFQDAADLAARSGWTGRVIVSGGRALVDYDGALFPVDLSNRFFRGPGDPPGAGLLRMLHRLGVAPRTIFDVGANIGELSIYFARRLPETRVVAFEPAPENIERFRQIQALQHPPLGNLELVAEAVSDRTGTIPMTVGAGLLNTTMIDGDLERRRALREAEVIEAPTDTLENFCERLQVRTIDFLKLDMEGGEPRLAASIRALRGRIGVAYVEISRFNTPEAYLELVDAFAEAGLVMAGKKLHPVDEPSVWLREQLAALGLLNVWFLDAERLRRDWDR
jgi:FkbM family methyltransferase